MNRSLCVRGTMVEDGRLAIREPGSPDDASMLLAGEAGWPRVVTAGRFLAPPGGYFPGLARDWVRSGSTRQACDVLSARWSSAKNCARTSCRARSPSRSGSGADGRCCPGAVTGSDRAGSRSTRSSWFPSARSTRMMSAAPGKQTSKPSASEPPTPGPSTTTPSCTGSSSTPSTSQPRGSLRTSPSGAPSDRGQTAVPLSRRRPVTPVSYRTGGRSAIGYRPT